MNTGTKIALAVIAVFFGVLVVYYGIIMGTGEPDLALADDPTAAPRPEDASGGGEQLRPGGEGPASPGEPAAADQAGGGGPVLGRDEPQAPAVNPVPAATGGENATDPPAGDGGKDGPIPSPGEAAPGSGQPGLTPSPAESDPQPAKPKQEPAQPPAAQPREEPETAPVRPQAPPPRPVAEPRYTPYVVKSGDTLSAIAQSWFGDANEWGRIADANPGLNPNRLKIGQTLRLPPRNAPRTAAPRPAASGSGGAYTVRAGDSLSSIARTFYNDATLWRRIYDANRAAIGSDPDALKVGVRLTIPPRPRDAGA